MIKLRVQFSNLDGSLGPWVPGCAGFHDVRKQFDTDSDLTGVTHTFSDGSTVSFARAEDDETTTQ